MLRNDNTSKMFNSHKTRLRYFRSEESFNLSDSILLLAKRGCIPEKHISP